MAKLQKREMIILGVMAIAVLYAAFEFLAPKKESVGRNIVQKTAEINTFVTGLTAGLGKDTTKSLNALVFSRAEKEWTQDPFLDTKSLRALSKSRELAKVTAVPAPAPKIEFTYTGYIEADRKRMAVINDMEYREGEELDIKGYVLKSISPANVVIENRATGTELTVSLQE